MTDVKFWTVSLGVSMVVALNASVVKMVWSPEKLSMQVMDATGVSARKMATLFVRIVNAKRNIGVFITIGSIVPAVVSQQGTVVIIVNATRVGRFLAQRWVA